MPPTPVRPAPRAARPRVTTRRRAALALAAGAALAGCGDDLLEAASRNNVDTVDIGFVAYPVSTAATPLPTAISVDGFQAVRPGVIAASGILVPNFDFAVDLAADGRVRLLPHPLVAGLLNTGRTLRTGLRVVNTPFDSLASAPSGDYQRDSATVVARGQTFVVETEPVRCVGSSRTFIYAKFVVDSVSSATGGVFFRSRIDPNCGYRSLRPGRPTS